MRYHVHFKNASAQDDFLEVDATDELAAERAAMQQVPDALVPMGAYPAELVAEDEGWAR